MDGGKTISPIRLISPLELSVEELFGGVPHLITILASHMDAVMKYGTQNIVVKIVPIIIYTITRRARVVLSVLRRLRIPKLGAPKMLGTIRDRVVPLCKSKAQFK